MSGTVVLALGILAGALIPPLSSAMAPLLPATVFVFVCATFLRADPALLLASLRTPRESLLLPVIATVGMPLTVAALTRLVGVPEALGAALVLTLACPPSSANAALARLFDYRGETPLTVILITMIAAPLTLPLVAALVGIALDPLDLMRGLTLLLASAAGLAWILRRALGTRLAAAGPMVDRVILAALLIFALGAMEGVLDMALAAPWRVAGLTALAFALNAGSQALGARLADPAPNAGVALGLTFGNRNVGLPWAVLGAALDPGIALFFALWQLPIFILPWVLMRLRG